MKLKKLDIAYLLLLVTFLSGCGKSSLTQHLNSLPGAMKEINELSTQNLTLSNLPCAVAYTALNIKSIAPAVCDPQPTPAPFCNAPSGYTKIRTPQDLQNIGASPDNLSKNYFLCNDIDLAGIEWMPIGSNTQSCNSDSCLSAFRGIFDGNHKTILSLGVQSAGSEAGLFGFIYGGTVRRLTLLNAVIYLQGGNTNTKLAGTLAAFVHRGRLEDIVVQDSSLLTDDYPETVTCYVGGIAGSANFTSGHNLQANGTNISASSCSVGVGGIFGYLAKDEIFGDEASDVAMPQLNDSSVNETLIMGNQNVGGLVGKNWGTITNSCARQDVSVQGTKNIGGVAGTNFFQISRSCSEALVGNSTSDKVGGLVGSNTSSIEKSYASGEVHGNSIIGGLVGGYYGYAGQIESSYATGAVFGNIRVGGFVGFISAVPAAAPRTTKILNSYSISNVHSIGTDPTSVGGFAGEIGTYSQYNSVEVSNAYFAGSVQGPLNSIGAFVGSITGYYPTLVTTERSYYNQEINQGISGTYGGECPVRARVTENGLMNKIGFRLA